MGEEEVKQAMEKIGVLARLHKSLLEISKIDDTTRLIDEALILYIETEKKGRISSIADLSQMPWSSLTQSDTATSVMAYPSLVAAVSKTADSESVDSLLKELPSEDQGPVAFLFESFPDTSRSIVVDVFLSCNKDVDATVTILQETASDATLLASSRILGERFRFVKQFNEDFKACYSLIDFRKLDKFYSIASLLSKHRAYLLYIVKVQFKFSYQNIVLCIILTVNF